jgi:hypothetical protein
MEILGTRNYIPNELADSVNALIPFKEKMKIFINLNKQRLTNLIN